MGPGLLHDPYVDMTSHLFLLHIRSALCHSRWSGMGGPLLITPPSDSYSDKRGSGARDMEGYQTIMFGFFHLLTLCTLGSYVTPFRICAFNGQHFGEKKVANDEILNVVVKIVQRCDICLLQEVHDPKGTVVSKLMSVLNRPKDEFLAVSSPPLGRKSYTEQYVFIYKSFMVTVRDQYKYEDNDTSAPDVFAREPYIVRFALELTALPDLVIIPQHTEPEKAGTELEALYDVFTEVRRRWRCKNVVLMGDFNAGCKYLSKKKTKSLRLSKDPDFQWLISDGTDTTVKESTSCAYDRIVIYGEELRNLVKSAGIYNFTKELRLSEAEALKVSDHYPVEMDLGGCRTLLPSLILIILSLSSSCGIRSLL